MDSLTRWKIASDYERAFDQRGWIKKIPSIQFPQDWLITIIPPFAGALIRFCVATQKNPEKEISVYLDCYSMLGYYDDPCEPHWEIYPNCEGDNERFAMNDVDALIGGINAALSKKIKKIDI